MHVDIKLIACLMHAWCFKTCTHRIHIQPCNVLRIMYIFVHPNQMNQTLTKITTCRSENISAYIKNYKGVCHDMRYPYSLTWYVLYHYTSEMAQ